MNNKSALRAFIEERTGHKRYHYEQRGYAIDVTTEEGRTEFEVLKAKLLLFGCRQGVGHRAKDIVAPNSMEQVLCLTEVTGGVSEVGPTKIPAEYKLFQLR